MSGGVRLTEDQYTDIMVRLIEIEDSAKENPHVVAQCRAIVETLEQEHYPVRPDLEPGEVF